MSDGPAIRRPGTPEEAVSMLASGGPRAVYVGGGTILPVLPEGETEVLVDLTGAGLSGVRAEGGGLVVGSMTTMLELCEDRASRAFVGGVLSDMARGIGTHTVRGRATMGGNIAGWPYPTDGPVALMALRAELVLLASEGPRTVRIEEFYASGAPDLRAGELIVAVLFPRPSEGLRGGFARFGRPRPGAAAVDCCCAARLVSGRIAEARVVMNTAAGVPAPASEVEAMLVGARPTAGLLSDAARRAAALARDAGAPPERAGALMSVVRDAVNRALDAGES